MRRLLIGLVLLSAASSCGNDETAAGSGGAGASGGSGGTGCTGAYAYVSRYSADQSSVSHSGQAWRHVAILDLTSRIEGLTDRIEKNELQPDAGKVVAELDFFLRFNPDNGNQPVAFLSDQALKQKTYDDISKDKNLIDKLAGSDTSTDHKVWNDGTAFVGAPGAASPAALVDAWFAEIEQNAIDHANAPRKGPDDVALPVHVTADGRDLAELVQKFVTGAVAFSQGTDDYLDDDVADKGLLSPNTRDGDSPYTVLEHAWDEGFGYFGASHAYPSYTDEELAGKGGRPEYLAGYHDTSCDGALDLASEVNFGHSVNAGKRDFGSAESAKTDLTKDAWEAFAEGRSVIAAAKGDALTADELGKLKEARDRAVLAWEESIAATVVHYINDVLKDMGKMGSADYSFTGHAGHWSELKGFALVLQFNPRKKISDADFASLHEKVGMAPVLEAEGKAALDGYKQKLIEARALLAAAYGFAPANVGDSDGKNGW